MQNHINPDYRNNWQVPEFNSALWLGKRSKWCLIIPVLNEGSRIIDFLNRLSALNIHQSMDIIIVDGGSTDNSLELENLKKLHVHGLLIKTGKGKLSAQLRCAYAFALDEGYDGIITIDGNNKDDPKSIPKFIKALQENYDFVQASRYLPGGSAENTPKYRDLAIRWIHAPLLRSFSGFKWTDTTQGFRAYSRKMLLDPKIAPFRRIFTSYELLAYLSYRAPKLGYHCLEIPSIRRYPKNEVPTKISSVKGNLSLLLILLRACLGHYNPK